MPAEHPATEPWRGPALAEFTVADSAPAVRIDVIQTPDAAVTARPAVADPAEHMLNVIALRLLAAAPVRRPNTSLDVAGLELAQPGIGDVTAAPDAELPERWRSVLFQRIARRARGDGADGFGQGFDAGPAG